MALRSGGYPNPWTKDVNAHLRVCRSHDALGISLASLEQHSACMRTFNARRYVYSLKGPPSAEALTAVRAVLQAVILLVSMLIFGGQKERKVHSAAGPGKVQEDDAMVRIHHTVPPWTLAITNSHVSRLLVVHKKRQGRWTDFNLPCVDGRGRGMSLAGASHMERSEPG